MAKRRDGLVVGLVGLLVVSLLALLAAFLWSLSSATRHFDLAAAAQAQLAAVSRIEALTFASDDAIGSALASPATPTVLGDLPNFTNIAPELSRGVDP